MLSCLLCSVGVKGAWARGEMARGGLHGPRRRPEDTPPQGGSGGDEGGAGEDHPIHRQVCLLFLLVLLAGSLYGYLAREKLFRWLVIIMQVGVGHLN